MRIGRADGAAWLRLSEAAALLGVGLNTLRRWSDSGRLACYRSPGGHRRYRRTDIEAFLERQSRAGRSPLADAARHDTVPPTDAADRDGVIRPELVTLAQVAAEGIGVSSCLFATVDSDGRLRAAASYGEAEGRDLLRAGEILTRDGAPVADEVQHTHRRVVIADVAATNLLAPAEIDACRARHDAAVLALPLATDGLFLGVMQLVDRRAPRVFTASNIAFAEFVARQAAGLVAREVIGDVGRGETPSSPDDEVPADAFAALRVRPPAAGDPRTVLHALADRLRRQVGAVDCVVLALADDDGLVVIAAAESTDEALRARPTLRLTDLGATAAALRRGETLGMTLDDARPSAVPHSFFERSDARHVLLVPLRLHGATRGLIALASALAEPTYTSSESDLIQAAASVAALALATTAEGRRLTDRVAELDRLIEALAPADAGGDAQEFLQAFATLVGEVSPGTSWTLYGVTDGLLTPLAGPSASPPEARAPGNDPDVAAAVTDGRPHLARRGDEEVLLLPLRSRASTVGVIELSGRPERELRTLATALTPATQALAATIAARRTTSALERRVHDLETIARAGVEDAARLGTDEVLHAVLQRLADLTQSPVADVYAVEGGTLRALISYDAGRFDPEWGGIAIPLSRYPVSRRAVESGQIAIAASLEDEILGVDGRSSLERWGYQSQLSIPLVAAGRVIGLVELSDYVTRDFAADLELIRGLGRVAAQALENARLFELVERRSRILNELVEIGAFASTCRDLDTVLRHAAERLLATLDVANCDIYRLSDDGLRCVVSYDRSGFDDEATGRLLDVSLYPTLVANVAQGRLLVVSSPDDPQLTERERVVYREYGFSSEVCVPLIVNDELFGLIDIYDTRPRQFGEYLSFLRSLGMSLAGSVSSTLLLQQLEHRTTVLREIVEIGALAAKGGDLEPMLARMAGRIRTTVGAADCDVYALDDGVLHCLASVDENGADGAAVGVAVRASDYPVIEMAVHTREPMVVSSLGDPRVTARERQIYAEWGFESLVSLPLSWGEDVLGVVHVFDTRERDYGEYLDFLHQAGQIVAGALDKAQLLERLERSKAQLGHLVDAGLEFGATLEAEVVLRHVAERLSEAAQAKACDIYAVEGDSLRCLASVSEGVADEAFVGTVYDLGRFGAVRDVLAGGHAMVVRDMADDERVSSFERAENLRYGHRAKVELPLVARGEIVGLAAIFDDRPRDFGDLELLQGLAQVAANALADAELYNELAHSTERVTLVGDVSFELSSSLDLGEVLQNTAFRLCALADMPRCDLYTLDAERRLTRVVSLIDGEADDGRQGQSLSVDEWSALRAAVDRRMPIAISSLDDPLLNERERSLMTERAETAKIVFPLVSKDVVIGVLELLETRGKRTFHEAEIATVAAVCRVAALAIHNAALFDDIKRMHRGNLKALSSALNAKDYYTLGHAARVAAYMVLLGEELGWDPGLLREIEEAAYLHDIGKIGVSDRVLLKSSGLNPREWQLMRQHPAYSADIIRPLFSDELVTGVRHHHERYDGSGYPDGLAGDTIPLIARAMCVVDSYDAMSFRRPYRQALSYPACREELARCSGAQFDPAMVSAFERVLDRLRALKDIAVEVASVAADRLDREAHAVLQRRQDESSEAYRRVVETLRAVRDEHPPTRYLTTFIRKGWTTTLVADAEENEALRSHIGDETFSDEELLYVFADAPVERAVLFVDQFGVWISGGAPVRDERGEIVAVTNADLPATTGATEVDGLRSDVTQTFATMVADAAARLAHAELEAITDGLTGLYNHRYLHERLDEEIERCVLQGDGLAFLLVDLDDFRVFNDRYGHSAGDRALRTVAQIIESSLRQVDLAARYGGEEFAVILIDTDEAGAREVAERIREAIVGTCFTLGGETLSVSIGMALCPADATQKEELLDKADWAMHLAKRRGRDQAVSFGAEHGAITPERVATVHDDHVAALADVVQARDALAKRRRAAVTRLALATARELDLAPEALHDDVVAAAAAACGGEANDRFDKKGLAEQLAAVAATYESLVTRYPYRPQVSEAEALEELRSCPAFTDDVRLAAAFEAVLGRPRE